MAKTLYTCIIFFDAKNSIQPAKYRKINNLDNFESFARRRGGIYFNVYEKETKIFVKRVLVT